MKRSALALCAILGVAVGACGDGPPPAVAGVIDRDTFIDTYVDLRSTTVARVEPALSDEARDSVLARHGVDAASLLAFVDAYGRDIDFMNDVWSEVEQRFEALTPAAATPEDGAG